MNRRINGAGSIGRAAVLRSGESGNHVSDSQFTGNRSGDELAEIERAAMAMAQRAEVPRWFLLRLVAVIAAVFTSFNVAHWGPHAGFGVSGHPLLHCPYSAQPTASKKSNTGQGLDQIHGMGAGHGGPHAGVGVADPCECVARGAQRRCAISAVGFSGDADERR